MNAGRPRLVFFQFRYDPRLPRFLLMQKDEHVRCLQRDFDVTVVREDCDFDAVCTRLEPDLVLFESGVPHPACRRLRITGARRHPRLPRLGLLHADAFCQGREGFLSDMHEWGVDSFFAVATAALDFNRELEGRLFTWPNAIDPAIYRDYGEPKRVDVLFTGNTGALYPWRRRMLAVIPPAYPALVQRHTGYGTGAAAVKVGEDYARMINGARVVPACGTAAHEIVRKHFEVPGCHACLVTERTATLEAAGFADMVNCVFADEHTVLDKLQRLFAHPDELLAITRAGHALVHAQHTLAQRTQVRQWFDLQRIARPGQVIDQPGPFAALRAVPASAARFPPAQPRPQLELLARGDAALAAGSVAAARAAYLRCSHVVDYMPEPQVRLALCALLLGRPAQALSRATRPLEFTLGTYGAADPDPVEWATYLLCLLCLGRRREAARKARLFAHVDHLALRRLRWLVAAQARPDRPPAPLPCDTRPGDRLSIHRLPATAPLAWVALVGDALQACGQRRLAQLVRAAAPVRAGDAASAPVPRLRIAECAQPATDAAAVAARAALVREFERRAARRRRAVQAVDAARHWLHGAERRLGFFLPYRWSAIRHVDFFRRLREAFEDPAVRTGVALRRAGAGRVLRGFVREGAASGKAARLVPRDGHALPACRDAQLVLVDCGAGADDELAVLLERLAETSEHLFLVDCPPRLRSRLEDVLGQRFDRAEAALPGHAPASCLAWRRRPARADARAVRRTPAPTWTEPVA